MISLAQSITYRFDSFVLDAASGSLRGPDAQDLRLRPKGLALLLHLLASPGRLHSREDLLEALWPGVTVTDDSLTQCVSDLRHAFGARATHVLRTVPRRGYVLAADVQRFGDSVVAPRSSNDLWAAMEAGRTAALLVAPLEHPAGDVASATLAHAVGNDLLTELAAFEDVRALPALAGSLEDGFRICGEVRRAGTLLRISIRLDSPEGVTLFGERLEAPVTDTPELNQSEIRRLASALVQQINLEDLRRARITPDVERTARQLWLLGRDRHFRGTEADTAVAIAFLERAIELDPEFATPYAWLSYTVQRGFTHGWGNLDPDAARHRALMLAQRAVTLEPHSPLTLSRLAWALVLHETWDEALATARYALTTMHDVSWESRTTACEVLIVCGEAEEAVRILTDTIARDPLAHPTTRSVLGRALLLAGRPLDALPELRACAARLADYAPCFHSLLVAAHEAGQTEQARSALREITRLQPWWTPNGKRSPWPLRREADRRRYLDAFEATSAPEPACDVPTCVVPAGVVPASEPLPDHSSTPRQVH